MVYWWVVMVLGGILNLGIGSIFLTALKRRLGSKNPEIKDPIEEIPISFFGYFFWPITGIIFAKKLVAEIKRKRVMKILKTYPGAKTIETPLHSITILPKRPIDKELTEEDLLEDLEGPWIK